MPERTILVMNNLPFEPRHWDRLKEAIGSDRAIYVDPDDRSALDNALRQAEIAILAGDLDERHVNAPHLRWVHCDHAGLTKSARPEVFEKGLVVTGSAGRSGPALAEHVMMFSLMLCSRYPAFYDAQKQHEWRRADWMWDLRALYGRTIGILGMGHTGKALATRAKAFNMRVLGYRRRDLEPPPGVDRMYSADKGEGIDAILAEADILALVLNLSDATHRMIGAAEIAKMKSSAIIVNLSRGGVIDTDALMAALNEGRLAGAGLDVTDPEPLPPGHPLWDTPNVLITPHFTAALPDKVDRSVDVITENLRRYRAGEEMQNRMTAEDLWTAGQ
ncbi:D-2-hydroxyacid dehydrogenase [Martelella endophytica]|uniref:2-hydroxyacid dehydrogenase n=1 Tax=Martelella endophytica TaxID=1486262 RepID=A0A0D5LLR1_MAREN|nr:D-2-hydroxyacid dehydrogenase [Martelella endophytica]AJY44870.1 2-hydroxyacid dehydrogenase [Martelella endophytica]